MTSERNPGAGPDDVDGFDEPEVVDGEPGSSRGSGVQWGGEALTDEAVSAVNARFYRALETGDLDLMIELWDHGSEASCAHPGRPPLVGWPAIESSWRAIFAARGNPQIIVTEERVVRRGSTAWVTAAENMISGGHAGAATAINVFHHDGRRWRMVAHHAAPVIALQ